MGLEDGAVDALGHSEIVRVNDEAFHAEPAHPGAHKPLTIPQNGGGQRAV
jgi:hypothetical protein